MEEMRSIHCTRQNSVLARWEQCFGNGGPARCRRSSGDKNCSGPNRRGICTLALRRRLLFHLGQRWNRICHARRNRFLASTRRGWIEARSLGREGNGAGNAVLGASDKWAGACDFGMNRMLVIEPGQTSNQFCYQCCQFGSRTLKATC